MTLAPVQSVLTYPAEAFRVALGANLGDPVSFLDELELDDAFALPPLSAVGSAATPEPEPEPQPEPEPEPEPEPDPEPAVTPATEKARTAADALSGLLLAARLAVDESLPEVAEVLARADEQLAQAEAAAAPQQ